jgi:stearoyl-CoA desaturase (Delta-9 desaturase)
MIFEWYWYFLFYILWLHATIVSSSLYVHRTIGHGHFVVSKPLEYTFRFILWTNCSLGSRWAETYAARHRKHHQTSDTVDDPQSPYYLTVKQMLQGWKCHEEDVKKYCPEIKTPNDWMQKTMHEKYHFLGPWAVHLLTLLLFGPIAMGLSVIIISSTKSWLGIFIGNYMTHKIGFNYAGHKTQHDQSKNIFPIGFFLAGEELHNNHHNNPRSPKFSQRWFEFDLGYVYAVILSKFGLMKFTNRKIIC